MCDLKVMARSIGRAARRRDIIAIDMFSEKREVLQP
jgi:hypothetical protein